MTPTCRDGNHDLETIYACGPNEACEVVRWCKECGAIVIDLDYDGHTQPGRVRAMEFPKVSS